jgi:hypothetical protein
MTAFCDVDISKAACAAEAYGTDNAKVYDDYKALLKDDTIDVLSVPYASAAHAAFEMSTSQNAVISTFSTFCKLGMASTCQVYKKLKMLK